MSSKLQTETSIPEIRNLVFSWLQSRLDDKANEWLKKNSKQLIESNEDWLFFTSFSAAPRNTSKSPLDLSEEEKKQALQYRKGWTLDHWSTGDLSRTYLLLCIAEKDKKTFLDWIEKTFISSDMGEAVALHQALPVLPYPEELTDLAAEGVRSNMTSVFNAIALRNPFPADYMDKDAWNQMVLKALFVESPLYLIQGIDQRANEKLARMLVDYAHERWAADREVSPELWRPVGPFAKGEFLKDLRKVLDHTDELHRQAALLALKESPSAEAETLIAKHEKLARQLEQENITWNTIGRRANNA